MKIIKIITVSITQAGEIKEFSTKLPGNCAYVTALGLTAGEYNATQALANVSITFNSGLHNTINRQLMCESPDTVKRNGMLPLGQKVVRNSWIKGYVEDLSIATAYPLTVKIYLECETSNN